MGKQRIKPNYRRRVLRLPDLDHCKLAVLNSLGSPASRRVYEYSIDQFIAWYCSEPRLAFNQIVVVRYRMHLESRGLAANTINQQLDEENKPFAGRRVAVLLPNGHEIEVVTDQPGWFEAPAGSSVYAEEDEWGLTTEVIVLSKRL